MQDGMGRTLWIVFFVVACTTSMWFFCQFTYKMVPYLKLSQVEEADARQFSVVPLSENRYVVEAKFNFTASGQEISSSYVFKAPVFLNHYAAQNHIDKYWKLQKKWPVYYNLKQPSFCKLQKLFPFKDLFNFALTLCVLFYFVWLRSYISKLSS